MKLTYFDFTVSDLGEARQFFEAVFRQRFEKFPMPYEYYRITDGRSDEPGINGGIGAVKDAPMAEGNALCQVTIPVPDIDEFVEKVRANGGKVVEPKTAIPGIGWDATCAEPGGLKFGIIAANSQSG